METVNNAEYTNALLFSLKIDRGEKENISKKNQEKVKELTDKVINWHKSMPVEIAVN